jgi:hypothetical protein
VVVADEALRYVNLGHRRAPGARPDALRRAADHRVLTATPRGKSAEHLDVLVDGRGPPLLALT